MFHYLSTKEYYLYLFLQSFQMSLRFLEMVRASITSLSNSLSYCYGHCSILVHLSSIYNMGSNFNKQVVFNKQDGGKLLLQKIFSLKYFWYSWYLIIWFTLLLASILSKTIEVFYYYMVMADIWIKGKNNIG